MHDTTGQNKDPNELSKRDILQGRIYPAIQSCVNNRYKIILGIFAYYSFIYTSDRFACQIKCSPVNFLASIIFSIFVVHNLVNYWCNARDQLDLESENKPSLSEFKKWPWMEIIFGVTTLFLIWGAHSILNNSWLSSVISFILIIILSVPLLIFLLRQHEIM